MSLGLESSKIRQIVNEPGFDRNAAPNATPCAEGEAAKLHRMIDAVDEAI